METATVSLDVGPGRGAAPRRRRRLPIVLALASVAIGGGVVFWNQAGRDAREAPANSAPPTPAPIDGRRAMGYLDAICKIGPRVAGSEANARQRAMVAAHFKAGGAEVRDQPFAARHPLTGRKVDMVNLVGSWHPDRPERVVIAAHYDTRPFADMEDEPVRSNSTFLGANDGASGVAVLMELANHLGTSPTPWGVDLVLLDGEELVFGRTREEMKGTFFLGSRAFGKAYEASRRRPGTPRYAAGIVLDMVGDKDLTIDKEPMSLKLAGSIVRQVWDVAARLDPPATAFRDNVGPEVLDDHLPMNDSGIPTIDIIDFDYPHWHRATDLPEQCSPASLEQVGRVVSAWLALPKPEKRSTRKGGTRSL